MRLGDLDALKVHISELMLVYKGTELNNAILTAIDNAPTVDLKDIYQEGHYDGYLEGYTKAINEERPQGEWENDSDNLPICNKCEEKCGWYEESVKKGNMPIGCSQQIADDEETSD